MAPAEEIGNAIVLEAPVTKIAQDAKGVTVISEKGEWHADSAIVAVPLPLSVRIQYSPPLPLERDLLAQRIPMGSVTQVGQGAESPPSARLLGKKKNALASYQGSES